MKHKFLSRPRRSRAAFVALLLVGALGLSGVLAYQAFDAGRSHEEVAYKTIKEQALFAAWEYSGIARSYLASGLVKPGLDYVAKAGGKEAGAELDHVSRPGSAGHDWEFRDAVGAFFRYDIETGDVAFSGPPDPGLEQWVRSRLPARVDVRPGDGWEPALVAEQDAAGPIAYRLYPEGWDDAELVYGFRVHEDALTRPLRHAFADRSLLPEAITKGRPNQDLFWVSVHDPEGHTVWSSDQGYESKFHASDTLGVFFAGLVTDVVVNPQLAETLIIGGLPRSRLPLVMGLLALTAGLVAGALFQLRREAELAQLRGDFVSGVSHELRTPLAQIRMFAETLLLGRVRNEEETRRSLEIIVNESQRLSHQVDNLLFYSRSERQGVRLERHATDLNQVVTEVAEGFQPLARAARCRLTVSDNGELPAEVDGRLVRQALLNLLDNGVKYGPAGQDIGMGVEGIPGQNAARIWVEDEGPGVPAEERGRIWEPYFRLASHRESAVAGSGIGLAVVWQVAAAHGGSVRVEAGQSGGARFVVELPLLVPA